jgi:predicted trehalose synthase
MNFGWRGGVGGACASTLACRLAAFVRGEQAAFRTLLEVRALDKALCELRDELDHRRAWAAIPTRDTLWLSRQAR